MLGIGGLIRDDDLCTVKFNSEMATSIYRSPIKLEMLHFFFSLIMLLLMFMDTSYFFQAISLFYG